MPIATADYCPNAQERPSSTGKPVHSYINLIYWGESHPKCANCGYVDVSRLLDGAQ